MRRVFLLVACILLSAAMQTAIFPVAGPLPFWRAQLAWVALVPWFRVLLSVSTGVQRPLIRATLWSYLCGVLWYMGHCYWIFQTMHLYGNLSVPMAIVVLVLFCLYLGLYHALFGFLFALQYRAYKHRLQLGLLAVLVASTWIAVELARARVTSFPWDLLGYSQIDNPALTALAPFTGVYALGFLVALVNAAFALAICRSRSIPSASRHPGVAGRRIAIYTCSGAFLLASLSVLAGCLLHAPLPLPTQQAIAVQPNLNPSPQQSAASATPLEQQLATLSMTAFRNAGSPTPQLILWPEAPTPFELHEQLLQSTLTTLAATTGATVIADSNAVDTSATYPRRSRIFNSAGLFTRQGLKSRYDKIHLVPFGEFVPYADLFQFAGGLTEQVGTFDRGTRRVPLTDGQHSYGIFICYESIFPDEVRRLVQGGAQVLVNLSDDGWYGDTSAPFQHSNMARMRAIENRRWLLRDTNTGITESIDPYGNIRAVAPRHQQLAIAMPFAYAAETTFYTRHGDIFAWLCTALAAAALLTALAQQSRTQETTDH